jgi:hypothetical protein
MMLYPVRIETHAFHLGPCLAIVLRADRIIQQESALRSGEYFSIHTKSFIV